MAGRQEARSSFCQIIDKKLANFFSLFTLHISLCPPFTLHRSPFTRKAFTLAEVIIVIGIIGVIAGITTPTLINVSEKQATIGGFTKAYSTLQNAIKRSEADNGDISTWNFPTITDDTTQGLDFFNTYLKPYLSIAKSCETAETGCWSQTNIPYGTIYYCTGLTWNKNIKYILNDGMALSIRSSSNFIGIYVDINGLKNPNIMGRDVFSFVLVRIGGNYNGGAGNLIGVNIGGIYPDGSGIDITTNSYTYRGCGKDVTNGAGGSFCGMKIIRDGYQIKDDYAW